MRRQDKILSFALSAVLWLIGFLGRDYLQKNVFKDKVPDLGVVAIWTIGCIALIAALFALFRTRHAVADTVVPVVVKSDLQTQWATKSQLDELLTFGRAQYSNPDDQFVSRQILTSFMQKCATVVRLFRDKHGKLVGLYILLPLTHTATKEILAREILSAKDFKPEHAARDFSKAAAIYVTNICGAGQINRGKVHRELRDQMRQIGTAYHNIEYFFARGGAPDGIRLLEKYDFEPIEKDLDPKQIWKRRLTARL
ncbi:MAG: hypothetical protein IT168_32085 [Bryobacterales bacterium]|nr:hypothetical protein [Bryobacterales bacterium]